MKFILKQLPIAVLCATCAVYQFLPLIVIPSAGQRIVVGSTIWFRLNATSLLLATVTIFAGLFLYQFTDSLANEAEVDSPPGKPRDKFTDPLFVAGYMNRMADALEDRHQGRTTAKSRKHRATAEEALAEVWTRRRRFWTRLLWFAGFIIINQAEDLYRHKPSWTERMLCFLGMWMAWCLIVVPFLVSCVRKYDFRIERKLGVDIYVTYENDHADDAAESAEDDSEEFQRNLEKHERSVVTLMKSFFASVLPVFVGAVGGVAAYHIVAFIIRALVH